MTTNKEYAKKNKLFQECCKRANIEPSKRQASKWLNGKGIARKFITINEFIDGDKDE